MISLAFWLWLAALVGSVTLALGLGAWLLYRSASPEARALIGRLARLPLRRKLSLAAALVRDGRIPLLARAIPALLVLYLAMPLDLIPDFIPVIGHLDDLLALAVGVGLLLRFTPRGVLEEQLVRLEPSSVKA